MINKLLALAAAGLFALGATAAPRQTKVQHPEWSRNAVIYEVNMRQYSDDSSFASFLEQMPRLNELGVDILWFMPIHPISEDGRKGGLGSYYAVKDYYGVNPEYGTKDEFQQIVDKAHEMGMKVILDWVPNHSGRDNAWVTEHPDWYARDDKGEMFGPFDWTDVYKFDYSNPEMRKGMIDALKYWLTEVGIDGFRCDVAMQVPTDFWNEARPQLQAVKPDLFMLAEASEPDLVEEAFDMDYNWPMKDLFSEIADTQGQYTFVNADGHRRPFPAKNALAIDSLLAYQAENYAVDSYMMNMITNHDLNSWEGTEFERLGNLTGAFAVLSYTLPGMPLIYTGQETGLNRALEFFVKDTPPQWEPRNTFFTFYQKLNALKHDHKALAAGTKGAPMTRFMTESPDVYVFSRELDGDNVTVFVNLSATEQPVKFTGDAPKVEGMKDYFSGNDAVLPLTMAPGAYFIYTK